MEGIPILESVPFKEPAPLRSSNDKTLPFFLKSGPDVASIPTSGSSSPFLSAGSRRDTFVSFLGHPVASLPPKVDRMGSVLTDDRPMGAKKSRTCSAPRNTDTFTPFSASRDGDGVGQFSLQKRRRTRTKIMANDENGEKLPSRKRNSKGRCKEEPRATLLPDSLTSKGMQELDAKTLDFSSYANDLPLEHLMNGHLAFPHKRDDARIAMKDISLRMHVSSILQNLSQPFQGGIPASSKPMQKTAENRNLNFTLDLGFPPSRSPNEEKVKTSSFASNNALEVSAVQLPLMLHPIMPHEEFLRKIQLPACESVDALIRQAGEPLENKAISNEKARRSHMTTNTSLPYGQTGYQDIQGDSFANSKINRWYRAEPFKRDVANDDHLPTSTGHRFPFSFVPESNDRISDVKHNGMEKTVRLDIDLNKQLPEIEGAEAMIETPDITPDFSSLVSSKTANGKDSCMSVQSSSDASKEHYPATASPVDQVDNNVAVVSRILSTDGEILQNWPLVSENDAVNKQDSPLVPEDDAEKNAMVAPMNASQKLESATVSECARTHSDATQAVAGSSLTDDVQHDVPYSPRMQAAAHLLCKMARSADSFYIHAGHKAEGVQADFLIHRTAKAAERISAREMGMKASEEKKNQNKQQSCKISIKAQGKEGKEGVLANSKGSSTIPMKRKTNGLVTSHELWATPPKGAPRDPKPAHLSFASERMHATPLKENSVSYLYGKGNGARLDQQSTGVSLPSKISTFPCLRKEGKVAHAIDSTANVVFNSPAKAPPFLQKKSEKACEGKELLTHGSGSPKISRPRSSLSKSSSSSQKTSNNYNIKPGLAVKPQRPALPYVEGIRYGPN